MFFQVVICLTLVVCVSGQELTQPGGSGPPNFCFKNAFHVNDQYHKDAPSSEGSDLPECQSWKESSCCTLALMETLGNRSKVQGLYNFSHELCDPISPGCAEYLRNEDCFYWCEPMLGYFQTAADGNIENVPICAEYCNAWFNACKDDYTCFENWLEEYDPSLGITTCPDSYTCRTFGQVYRDGKGLCDTIWGTVYSYSTDADNCTVMAFNNTMPNPNYKLTFPRSGSLSQMMLGSTLMHVSVLPMLLLTSADIF